MLIDLMTDKEIEIWNELNAAERVGIILSFNLMLVKNGVDNRIVPSVKLNMKVYDISSFNSYRL